MVAWCSGIPQILCTHGWQVKEVRQSAYCNSPGRALYGPHTSILGLALPIFNPFCHCNHQHIFWQRAALRGLVTNGTLYCRGYVALAVATDKETSTKEAETGLGGDREGNMIAFAVEGLKLLREVIKGNAKL